MIIHVDFRKNRYSLREARLFLGGGFFRKALFEWSLTELEQTANHPEAFLTDAAIAYSTILQFRKNREGVAPSAEIIQIAA